MGFRTSGSGKDGAARSIGARAGNIEATNGRRPPGGNGGINGNERDGAGRGKRAIDGRADGADLAGVTGRDFAGWLVEIGEASEVGNKCV